MPRKSSQPPTPVGEVVLMNKPVPKPQPPPPPPPEPTIKVISATKYEKEVRPKKELSEKQKANLTKLIERNKAKAVERRATISDAIPEVIPEDKILVKIAPKRIYNRKPKEEIKNVVVEPASDYTPAPSESEYTESESEPEVKPRKRRERKQAPKKKIGPKYSYDTETTTADEDSSESEDDYKVAKYQVKAEKRIKALEKIDKRLSQLQHNPYQSREMSVF